MLMWIKNRLRERRLLECELKPPHFDLPTVPLHVFFLHLLETDEMLERLAKDEPIEESTVARSKVASTQLLIHPVDRVAARVSDPRMITQGA